MSPASKLVSFSRWLPAACLLVVIALPCISQAQDVHLRLPKRSKPTPVQKLNQDGVKAIEKHDYEKAKKLFYKAYLLDPNDPFTLNNLGYIAELDGEIDRAQRFYSLAADQPSQATIAVASNPKAKGKDVAQVAGNAPDVQMQINRANVYAMGLLMKDRAPEADLALQKALALDPKNPFTLNNLGFAKEKEGELELALKYYSDAANTGSNEPVIVTLNKDWRGKPIREVAAENARKTRKELDSAQSVDARVARLNLRGVSAVNRNDRRLARNYFEQAYKLDPNNAFTLNNMGYISEQDNDRESAEYFYAKAREAERNDAKVVLSTRREMEGQRVGAVAAVNDQTMAEAQQRDLEARRREGGPVELLRRDNTPVLDPAKPVNPSKRESAAPVVLPPHNESNSPSVVPGNGMPPANNAQPANSANQPVQNVIEPLPDTMQPGNADKGAVPATTQPGTQPAAQPTQPTSQPPVNPPQGQQQQPQGQRVMDVIPPLPENQQPPNADKGAPSQQPGSAPPNQQQPPPPQ